MFATLLFSGLAALAVWLAGRNGTARSPRLTAAALVLVVAFPALLWLPKLPLLPTHFAPSVNLPTSILTGLLIVWGIGCKVATFRMLMAWRTLRRWKAQSRPMDLTMEGFEMRSLAGLQGPVACGVISPIVFVPADWQDWSEDRRRSVLLHECAHHRRFDPMLRWLAAITCAIHWFNPLVHWMAKRMALQCEHACDLEVLRAGVQPDEYATLLCDIATEAMPTPACAMAERSSLEARVRFLMSPQRVHRLADAAAWLLLIASIAALAFIGKQPEWTLKPDPIEVQQRLHADPFPGDH